MPSEPRFSDPSEPLISDFGLEAPLSVSQEGSWSARRFEIRCSSERFFESALVTWAKAPARKKSGVRAYEDTAVRLNAHPPILFFISGMQSTGKADLTIRGFSRVGAMRDGAMPDGALQAASTGRSPKSGS